MLASGSEIGSARIGGTDPNPVGTRESLGVLRGGGQIPRAMCAPLPASVDAKRRRLEGVSGLDTGRVPRLQTRSRCGGGWFPALRELPREGTDSLSVSQAGGLLSAVKLLSPGR